MSVILGNHAEATMLRLAARSISSRTIPSSVKQRVARHRLVHGSPARASALAKAFSEDSIVPRKGPAGGLTEELLRTKKSLIRFGDGEALLLLGKSTFFQLPDPTLRSGLFEAFFGYRADSGYLLGVMGTAFRSPDEIKADDADGKSWRNHAKVRGLEAIARRVGARVVEPFDANSYRDWREDPSSLGESAGHLVVVTNRRVFLESEAEGRFFGVRRHHVEVPEVDVLPHLSRICDEVRGHVRSTGLAAREVPVIVAAGAVGKLVVLQLMAQHWVLDLGAYVGRHAPWPTRPSIRGKKPRRGL